MKAASTFLLKQAASAKTAHEMSAFPVQEVEIQGQERRQFLQRPGLKSSNTAQNISRVLFHSYLPKPKNSRAKPHVTHVLDHMVRKGSSLR